MSANGRLTAVPLRVSSDGRTVAVGRPTELFDPHIASGGNIVVAGANARAQYVVSADGRFLINSAAGDVTTPPITIVQNWTALVKR